MRLVDNHEAKRALAGSMQTSVQKWGQQTRKKKEKKIIKNEVVVHKLTFKRVSDEERRCWYWCWWLRLRLRFEVGIDGGRGAGGGGGGKRWIMDRAW
jgi:hypothetical protein